MPFRFIFMLRRRFMDEGGLVVVAGNQEQTLGRAMSLFMAVRLLTRTLWEVVNCGVVLGWNFRFHFLLFCEQWKSVARIFNSYFNF